MIQLGNLKPELLKEKIEMLSYHYTFPQLVERYVELQHQLAHERALGEWLDALANAYRDDNDDAWQEEQIAKDRMNEIKKEIKAKYE